MIMKGIVKKTEGSQAWIAVRPEGGTCGDCSCEKPERIIKGRIHQPGLESGDVCIVETSSGWALGSALVLLLGMLGGGLWGWQLGNHSPMGAVTLAALGIGVAYLVLLPFRKYQEPMVKKVSIQLHGG